jgi:hypothetical protein
MKPSHEQIEKVLRNAPVPAPPPDLKPRLISDIPPASPVERQPLLPRTSWFPRWRFALASGAVAVVSLVALGYQQARVNELNTTVAELRQQLEHPASAVPDQGVRMETVPTATLDSSPTGLMDELERLRTEVGTLRAEIETLEALRAENEQLRVRIASAGVATIEQTTELLAAREKARSIQCVNHLKNLGLAGRIYASDHDDLLPPDIISMTNEIGSLKILVCPADPNRTAAQAWDQLTQANVSYEFLAPSAGDSEPNRVMFQCPIHGHIALCDGSVQQAIAKDHPERLTIRDGALYLVAPAEMQGVPDETGTP